MKMKKLFVGLISLFLVMSTTLFSKMTLSQYKSAIATNEQNMARALRSSSDEMVGLRNSILEMKKLGNLKPPASCAKEHAIIQRSLKVFDRVTAYLLEYHNLSNKSNPTSAEKKRMDQIAKRNEKDMYAMEEATIDFNRAIEAIRRK